MDFNNKIYLLEIYQEESIHKGREIDILFLSKEVLINEMNFEWSNNQELFGFYQMSHH